MDKNKFFKQFLLGQKKGSQENEAFSSEPLSADPMALLELLRSFTVTPNVVQTAKAVIVGSGTNQIILDPNKGLFTNILNLGVAGLLKEDTTLSAAGFTFYVTGSRASLSAFDGTINLNAEDEVNLNGGAMNFTVLGGQSSTYVSVERRSNNPVIHIQNFESPPATCSVGDITVAGAKLYICTATNTWTVVGTQT